MLPVANAPFLTHQLARLRAAGVEHVVLATSYRAEVFEAHFGDGAELGLRIDYVTEDEPLGTGGGIRNVAGRLEGGPDDAVLVLNGDVLSGHDITEQLRRHEEAKAAVTLHLVRVPDPRAFGSVPTDGDGLVTAFVEKSPTPVSDQVNAGCYVFRRSVIDAIPPGQVVSVERDTFPALLADGARVAGYVENAYWLDMGTPASIVQASADLVRGVLPAPAVAQPGEALVDPGATVDPAASVAGGSALGQGVVVAADAVVDGSIVMSGARVGAGALVTRSVVGCGAAIGAGTVLVDAVVGDGAAVGPRNELREGARVWVDAVLGESAVRFSADA
jgi:mannose-1-phosphate guanylyltransferase